eukprot:CAMPEP_0118973498 /NCGR_PEP_ID=MMETSP1173-20130426/10306_1 /TAXON_ID=1034831 /ORGANISM="Rhizochromulina marina cf, Strain CCMP1243" /LENGTH=133 /DNA_ID=CAMNT_0006923169 /DNA_START=213 /DNA_END=614 /DNA_ORIENTATION=+
MERDRKRTQDDISQSQPSSPSARTLLHRPLARARRTVPKTPHRPSHLLLSLKGSPVGASPPSLPPWQLHSKTKSRAMTPHRAMDRGSWRWAHAEPTPPHTHPNAARASLSCARRLSHSRRSWKRLVLRDLKNM